ncbi:hypothetical protein EDD76_107183 [Kineothrix alysoides]|uniref:Uncharacterized protein n=1 Tax=Kineothrix alysoides TaxID=1469948 RepID=A0A4R1QYM9_9FIRM|nr:hypothetical protein [Kineothrix alysoides]TCL58068.1 hypothetical protein EDD76_107183 [Kineothrix alysoides]
MNDIIISIASSAAVAGIASLIGYLLMKKIKNTKDIGGKDVGLYSRFSSGITGYRLLQDV